MTLGVCKEQMRRLDGVKMNGHEPLEEIFVSLWMRLGC